MEPQDLSDEDPETNVDAGNEAQEASQVLGGDLTEVHRHNAERDTYRKKRERDYNICLHQQLFMHNFVY